MRLHPPGKPMGVFPASPIIKRLPLFLVALHQRRRVVRRAVFLAVRLAGLRLALPGVRRRDVLRAVRRAVRRTGGIIEPPY